MGGHTAAGDEDAADGGEERGKRARGVAGLRQGVVGRGGSGMRSEEHTSELQSHSDLVCRLLLEKRGMALKIGALLNE